MGVVQSPIVVLLFPVFKEIQQSKMSHTGGCVVALGLTLLCVIPIAALTFKLIENPANKYGRKLAKHMASKSDRVLVPTRAL